MMCFDEVNDYSSAGASVYGCVLHYNLEQFVLYLIVLTTGEKHRHCVQAQLHGGGGQGGLCPPYKKL